MLFRSVRQIRVLESILGTRAKWDEAVKFEHELKPSGFVYFLAASGNSMDLEKNLEILLQKNVMRDLATKVVEIGRASCRERV